MNKQLFHYSSTCLSALFCLVALTLPVSAAENPASEPEQEERAAQTERVKPLPLDEVRIFTEVLNRIRNSYVEPIDDKTLLENAIKGMLAGIDPHSSYLIDDELDNLQETTSGEFGGLGVEVVTEDGYIKVISPVDGSPADQAGIQPGDLIIQLDGTPARDITVGDTVNIMRGEPGSKIVLTIVREGVDAPFEVTVIRDIIAARSVRTRTLDSDYGYLRISQFSSNTGDEVRAAIEKFNADGKMHGFILDLRNNPGGVLQASVGVVDSFVSEGLILYTEGRLENSEMRFEATSYDPSQGVPLIVLINEGSASASEIVAGSLQDHNRAIIMGTKSFGKGSVQTVLPLTNNRALKLTTALYFTPSGRSIQALGITPDIIVDRGRVTSIPVSLAAYREEDLTNHLGNANAETSLPITLNPNPPSDEDEGEVIVSDYQLNEALNVLKGMRVLRQLESQTFAAAKLDDTVIETQVETSTIEADEATEQ